MSGGQRARAGGPSFGPSSAVSVLAAYAARLRFEDLPPEVVVAALAVAAHRDPDDPASFAADAIEDSAVRDLAARIEVTEGEQKGWGARLSIALRDGRTFASVADTFRGCPETPLSVEELAGKFRTLTGAKPGTRTHGLLDALLDLENVADVAELKL